MTPREQADAIAAAVCAEWGVTMDMIRGPSRTPAVSIPRQVLCEQLRFRTIMSLAEIGDYVNRDHTSVLYSVRQMAEHRDTVNRIANVEDRLQVMYTPLELAGRDIFVSEGCYNCHSQMIRMLKPDVMRYGDYSRLGESIYDHPFQWGSKRTGPDLAREGALRPDPKWHFGHMINPRDLSKDSRMPSYSWLLRKKTNIDALPSKIAVQRRVGVPYEAMTDDVIKDKARVQAIGIAKVLVEGNNPVSIPPDAKGWEPQSEDEAKKYLADKQIVALIAYLTKLGTYEDVPAKEKSRLINPVLPGLPDDFRKMTSEEPKAAQPVTATVTAP